MLIFGPQFAEKDIFLLNVTSVFWSPKIKQLGFELASENFDLFIWNRRRGRKGTGINSAFRLGYPTWGNLKGRTLEVTLFTIYSWWFGFHDHWLDLVSHQGLAYAFRFRRRPLSRLFSRVKYRKCYLLLEEYRQNSSRARNDFVMICPSLAVKSLPVTTEYTTLWSQIEWSFDLARRPSDMDKIEKRRNFQRQLDHI